MGIVSENELAQLAGKAVERTSKNIRSTAPRKPLRTGYSPSALEARADQEPFAYWGIAQLSRAIRAERQLGASGHWSYDLNRHIALRQAFTAISKPLRR